MRRTQADEKVGPTGWTARSGTTSTSQKNPSDEDLDGQAQKLPPQVPTALAVIAGEPPDFICSWCGEPNPWSRMGGWDRRIKFCDNCVCLIDTIELGAMGACK